jgi:hypothetical protein
VTSPAQDPRSGKPRSCRYRPKPRRPRSTVKMGLGHTGGKDDLGGAVGGRRRVLFCQGQHQGARFQPVCPTHQPRRGRRMVQRRSSANHRRQKRAKLLRNSNAKLCRACARRWRGVGVRTGFVLRTNQPKTRTSQRILPSQHQVLSQEFSCQGQLPYQ